MVKGLVKVGGHHYAVICCDTEKCYESDPYRYAKIDGLHVKKLPKVFAKKAEIEEPVLPVEPNHDEPACKGYGNTRKHHH